MNKKSFLNFVLSILFYLSWLIFYFKLLFAGDIKYYINPTMNIFSWIMFIFLFILMIYEWIIFLLKQTSRIKWSYLIFILPFLLVILLEPKTLSTRTIDRKMAIMNFSTTKDNNKKITDKDFKGKMDEMLDEYNKQLTDKPEISNSQKGTSTLKNRYSILSDTEFSYYLDKLYHEKERVQFIGKTFKIKGFYTIEQKFCKPNQAIVARYMITCCAADAMLVGYFIEFKNRPRFNKGDWIQVTGRLKIGSNEKSRKIAIFDVIHYQKVKKEHPYVFPAMPILK